MISMQFNPGLQSTIEKVIAKYPIAANKAARKSAFLVQSVCVKEFLTVADGTAVSRRGVRPSKRTTWPGLRRRTGTLARAVKVGVYDGSRFTIINSEMAPAAEKSILSAVAIGIGAEMNYGVIHEREGNHQMGRKDSGRNFYPFLKPAMQKATREVYNIFDREYRIANRGQN